MALKLIRDAHGRNCILGDVYAEPPPEDWLADQSIKPLPNESTWYSAYPLFGGAVCVQKGAFVVIRDVAPDDLRIACSQTGRNPATATIQRLVLEGTNHNDFK